MDEEDLPPPYTPAAEEPPTLTPRPSVHLRPAASSRLLSGSASDLRRPHPRPLTVAGPSSNVSLPSRLSTSHVPPNTKLQLSGFSVVAGRAKRQLVTVEEIKTHLRLLRAFRLFKEKVENLYSDPEVSGIVPSVGKVIGAKGRWLWFLEMAVERFRRWVVLLDTRMGSFVIPPVDVWLIWNTYMLNPTWYMEDCERLWSLRPLKKLKKNPLELAAAMGDNILNYRPTGDQEGLWEAGTCLHFDPFVSSATLVDWDIECPRCERRISTSLVNAEFTGFAQMDFATVCPYCDTLVTRESLGVAKFIRDLILDPQDTTHTKMHGKGVYLAGSLLTSSGSFQTSNAVKIKASIKRLKVFQNDNTADASTQVFQGIDSWKKAIGDRLRYKSAELRKNVEKASGVGDRMIRRILGAYVDGKPFSVELVAAAMRQLTFVDKIHQLGWLDPGFFGDPESVSVLQHCIRRYYGFLTLIVTDSYSKNYYVPTLDVDLAWHTHQLAPERYPKDCRNIAFRLIDHDDQVEEKHMAVGLDNTSKAWRGQFGTPYMYCGCPVKELSVGQRLSSFFSDRCEMPPPMSRDDSCAATHASEHSSIFLIGRSAWGRGMRQAEWGRRREKEGEKIGKGKRGGDIGERYLRGRDHEYPFLPPVPKTHGYGCPHTKQYYAAACAVGVSGCVAREERE